MKKKKQLSDWEKRRRNKAMKNALSSDRKVRSQNLRKIFNDFFATENEYLYLGNAEIVNDDNEPTGDVAKVRIMVSNYARILLAVNEKIANKDSRFLMYVLDQLIGTATNRIEVEPETDKQQIDLSGIPDEYLENLIDEG